MIHIWNGLTIYLRKRWDGWYWSSDCAGFRSWDGPWSTQATAINEAKKELDPWKRPLPESTSLHNTGSGSN